MCEYCNVGDKNKKIYDRGGLDVSVADYSYSKATLDIDVFTGIEYGSLEAEVKINYCPMCGRKLNTVGSIRGDD